MKEDQDIEQGRRSDICVDEQRVDDQEMEEDHLQQANPSDGIQQPIQGVIHKSFGQKRQAVIQPQEAKCLDADFKQVVVGHIDQTAVEDLPDLYE